MPSFLVKYKYSKIIDFGEIEAKNKKEAEEIANYKLWHNILSLRAEDDGCPYFQIKERNKRWQKHGHSRNIPRKLKKN